MSTHYRVIRKKLWNGGTRQIFPQKKTQEQLYTKIEIVIHNSTTQARTPQPSALPPHASSGQKSQLAKPRRGDILITPHVSVGETDTLTSSKPRRGDTHAVQLTPDKAEGRSLGLSGKLPPPSSRHDTLLP